METLRVLVADDEDGMRHSIKRALRDYRMTLPDVESDVDFVIDGVPSGEEALVYVEKQPPDLMLLDHKMDGMTGLDVLRELEKQPRDMLVIMITAFATIETAVRATKSGAFDFIAKPFTPAELKDTVHKAASHLLSRRQARRLADEKRKVRFEFIRVLGHELKAPLAAIEGYLNLLESRAAGEDIKTYEEAISRCQIRAQGMRKLIVDLLDMTRIEAGEKKREITEVDVLGTATLVIEGMQEQAKPQNIGISLEAPDAVRIQGDSTEISIILNNLISNAVKYNREGGTVTVRLQPGDGQLRIEVTDTGIGMSAEESARLFSDFVRIKNEKTRSITGSGLGLSIVKKIVNLYDGEVTVESEPDVGSTFAVTLHAASPESGVGDGEAVTAASSSPTG